MHKRLMGLLAAATIIVAACGASTATQAPGSQAPASVAPATPAPPVTPAPTAAPIPPDITTSTYAPEPVGNKGGKLVVGTSGEPNTIWWGIYDNFAADVEGFGSSLWSLFNNTADFKYYGQLAKSVPTVANGGVTLVGDGMDVKIDLIEGALWSDGKPITCQDLTDQWKWQMDPTNAGTVTGTQGYEDISSIDGGTGTNCVVHFKKVYEPYLGLWAPLLPMHYVNTVAPADAFTKLYTQADPKSGVYSGPWLPTNWSAGAQIDYVPNDNFWKTIKKADSPFDSYTLRFYSSVDALIAGYTNNEVDVAIEMNHNNLPALAASQVPPADVDAIDGLTYEHHSYNLANLTAKFGADGAKALMEALHYAYDKDAINQRVLGGVATPSCNFTSPLAWSYKDIPCYKTDMAKAEKILADAGFTKGSDGILVKNGNPVVLRACTRADRQYRQDTLTLVASQVQPLGIKFDLTNLATDPSILFAGWNDAGSDVPCNLTHGNFEVTEFAWVSTPDPNGIYGVYHSKYDPTTNATHAGSNYIRLHNDTVDTALDTSLTSVDLLKIKDEMGKVQDLYVDPANGFPEIALYNWRTVLLNNDAKVHNVVNNSTAATQTWNLEDWWRSQ